MRAGALEEVDWLRSRLEILESSLFAGASGGDGSPTAGGTAASGMVRLWRCMTEIEAGVSGSTVAPGFRELTEGRRCLVNAAPVWPTICVATHNCPELVSIYGEGTNSHAFSRPPLSNLMVLCTESSAAPGRLQAVVFVAYRLTRN